MDFVIGGVSAGTAGIFTNPLDVLKTRMQLQGELRAHGEHAVHYRNVLHAAVVVVKNDGVLGLQKGLFPALGLHFLRNFVRLGLYQRAEEAGMVTENGRTVFWRSAVISGVAGAAGAFCGSPLFLVKTQLQSQSAASVAVGFQHGHVGLGGALGKIYSDHGVFGLWRGAGANMLRALAGSSSQITSYAMSKDLLKNQKYVQLSPIATSFLSSVVSGVFQSLFITPFDLVSTRLYNQPVDSNGKGMLYKNIPDCFWKIWKTEGVLAFYKGLTANYMRLAPHGALTLMIWDILKDLRVKYQF